MRTVDVVIIGGGIIGASIAYHLALRMPSLRVVVLEREAQLGIGATAKATGGIRHQFSTAANISLTQLSYPEYLRFPEEHGQEIGFRAHGYLFCTSVPETWAAMRRGAELQRSLGVPTRLLAPTDVCEIVPDLAVDDLLGATYCAIDGSANASDAHHGYVVSARARGVEMLPNASAIAIASSGGAVRAVQTLGDTYLTEVVVDAAGPNVADVAALAGVEIPAKPFRRQVFVMAHDRAVSGGFPFTVDMDTGWYVHQEASGRLLFGGTDKDNRPGVEPFVDWDGFDAVARAALRRAPSMAERARVSGAYCGIRTLTPDHHGILGRVPELKGFLVATACNGHGFMHAPAVGLLLAEEILDGKARSLDLAPLSVSRFGAGRQEDEAATF